MKHLKFSMEGVSDADQTPFVEFRKKLFSRSNASTDDLAMGEKAAKELKQLLTQLKSKVQSVKQESFETNPSRGLHMLGVNAEKPKDLISYLKKFEKELDHVVQQERAIIKDAKQHSDRAKQDLGKSKALASETTEKTSVGKVQKMTFTKQETLELIDVGIGYCERFLAHKREIDGVATEGFFEDIFHAIVNTVCGVVLFFLNVAFTIFIIVMMFNFPFHLLGFVVGYKLVEFLLWKFRESENDDSLELKSMKF